MIYVYLDIVKDQVTFIQEPHEEAGLLIGTLEKMPEAHLAFVAHAMLRKKGIQLDRGISVVVAQNAT